MKAPCSILVPSNFSPGSDAALDYARMLATRVGAKIDVLHVRRVQSTPGRETFFADSEAGLEMQRTLTRAEKSWRIEVRGRVENGEIGATIIRVAEEERYDLIVLGQDTRGAGAEAVESLVAHRVAKSVRCPVITVSAAAEMRHKVASGW
jgi:nucleotide-binding universal stress UspA family protein